MAMRELYNELYASQIHAAALTGNADIKSSGVDNAGYNSLLFLIDVGVITDGTYTTHIQECATDDDASYTDVADGDMDGPAVLEPAFTSAACSKIHAVAYKGSLRYARVKLAVSGSPGTGGTFGIIAVQGHARHNPAGATQAP